MLHPRNSTSHLVDQDNVWAVQPLAHRPVLLLLPHNQPLLLLPPLLHPLEHQQHRQSILTTLSQLSLSRFVSVMVQDYSLASTLHTRLAMSTTLSIAPTLPAPPDPTHS